MVAHGRWVRERPGGEGWRAREAHVCAAPGRTLAASISRSRQSSSRTLPGAKAGGFKSSSSNFQSGGSGPSTTFPPPAGREQARVVNKGVR